MSESTLTDQQVMEGITSVMTAMLADSRKTGKESPLYSELVNNPKYLADPKSFFFAFVYKQEKAIEAAIAKVKQLPDRVEGEYCDIFLNFQFYKAHIEKICTSFEGSFACADKSAVIIGRYLHFLSTGDKGKWEVEEEKCYWLPRFGTQDQWFSFMHGLHYFRYAHVKEYFESYKALIEAGNAVYKPEDNHA